MLEGKGGRDLRFEANSSFTGRERHDNAAKPLVSMSREQDVSAVSLTCVTDTWAIEKSSNANTDREENTDRRGGDSPSRAALRRDPRFAK